MNKEFDNSLFVDDVEAYDKSITQTQTNGTIMDSSLFEDDPVDATMTVGGQPEVKIEPTKQELIEKEATLATKRIEQAKANIDELGLDEQQKNLILDRYDLAMVKIQDNKLEKMRKEEDYLAKKGTKYTPSETALDRTKEVASRINIGMGEAQGNLRINVLAKMAEKLGWKDTQKELISKGTIQLAEAERLDKEYKDKFGQDSYNIAQSIGEFVPDVATTMYMGARNVPSALGEGFNTYARTGDTTAAAGAAATTFLGGKLMDKIMEVGVKKVKTAFGNEIDQLPHEEKINTNKALDALDKLGIDKLDVASREKLLSKMDLTKPTEEITDTVKKELVTLKDDAYNKVNDAYNKANEIALASDKTRINSKDIKDKLLADNIVTDTNVSKALKEVNTTFSNIAKDVKSFDMNAFNLEGILSSLKSQQGSADGRGKRVFSEAIDYITNKQKELVGDIYSEPRELSKQFNTQFKGIIEGEGSDLGKKVEDITAKDVRFHLGQKILGKEVNPETAKDLVNLNLSKEAKHDLVKDVITKGLDTAELASKDNVNKIITNWNTANVSGLKQLLGDNYKDMNNQMKALELIQNTIDVAPEKESIKRNVINFITNASLTKISPVYATKGMIYEGRQIATKIAFREQQATIRERIKEIPDIKTRDKLMRSFNNAMIGYTADKLDSMFKEEEVE